MKECCYNINSGLGVNINTGCPARKRPHYERARWEGLGISQIKVEIQILLSNLKQLPESPMRKAGLKFPFSCLRIRMLQPMGTGYSYTLNNSLISYTSSSISSDIQISAVSFILLLPLVTLPI